MSAAHDGLVSRWLSQSGKDFINAVLNLNITSNQYKNACIKFFGAESCQIQAETFQGISEFEDLRGMDLADKDLRNRVFAAVDLSYAKLDGVQLDGASFSCAKIYASSLQNCVAQSSVDFFQCYAQGSNFQGVKLHGANFCNADLRYSNFQNSTLVNCDFSESQLQHSSFNGVIMKNCKIGGAHLSLCHQSENWYVLGEFTDQDEIIWED